MPSSVCGENPLSISVIERYGLHWTLPDLESTRVCYWRGLRIMQFWDLIGMMEGGVSRFWSHLWDRREELGIFIWALVLLMYIKATGWIYKAHHENRAGHNLMSNFNKWNFAVLVQYKSKSCLTHWQLNQSYYYWPRNKIFSCCESKLPYFHTPRQDRLRLKWIRLPYYSVHEMLTLSEGMWVYSQKPTLEEYWCSIPQDQSCRWWPQWIMHGWVSSGYISSHFLLAPHVVQECLPYTVS